MSALYDALTEYLATRRALGTQLRWPESSLRSFIHFLQAEGAESITTELAVRWACMPEGVQRAPRGRQRIGVRCRIAACRACRGFECYAGVVARYSPCAVC